MSEDRTTLPTSISAAQDGCNTTQLYHSLEAPGRLMEGERIRRIPLYRAVQNAHSRA